MLYTKPHALINSFNEQLRQDEFKKENGNLKDIRFASLILF